MVETSARTAARSSTTASSRLFVASACFSMRPSASTIAVVAESWPLVFLAIREQPSTSRRGVGCQEDANEKAVFFGLFDVVPDVARDLEFGSLCQERREGFR